MTVPEFESKILEVEDAMFSCGHRDNTARYGSSADKMEHVLVSH